MPGSDTGSSTMQEEKRLGGREEQDALAYPARRISLERVPSLQKTTNGNMFPDPENVIEADMEKGGIITPREEVAPTPNPGMGGPPPGSGFHPSDFPDGGLEAWLVVVGGFLVLFCSFGLVNCLGVFVEYYLNGPLSNYSASTVSWITSLQVFVTSGSNAFVGRLYDRYGPRWIMIIGTFLFTLGLVFVSLSSEFYQYTLSQGIFAAVGAAMVFNCATNSVIGWFFKKRATALGVVVSGSSLGGVVLPIMISRLIPSIGFPWTMRILALMVLVLCGSSCFLIKSRFPPRPKPFRVTDYVYPLRDTKYSLLVIGAFFVYWGLFLPFSYLNLQARQQGVSEELIPYLLPILNAVSIPGRILPGYVGDKLGRFNMIILIALLSGIISLALWIPGRSAATTIIFGAVFGFASGGYISLAPAVIAQISDVREIGTRTGVFLLIASLGGLTGSPIAGAIVAAQGGQYLGLQLFCGLSMTIGGLWFFASRTLQVGPKLNVKI